MTARTLNLILALWLFLSAFVWPRTAASFTNAWVVGLLAAVFAVVGMTRAKARFANTALSAWLLVAALVLPQRSPIARWNDLAVAVAMLLVSLVPGTMYRPVTTTRAPA
jgi:hypothetical protein